MNLLLKTFKIWCITLVLCGLMQENVLAQCSIIVPSTLTCGASGVEIPVEASDLSQTYKILTFNDAGWTVDGLNADSTSFFVTIPSSPTVMALTVEIEYSDGVRETCDVLVNSCSQAPPCDLSITTDTSGIACDGNGGTIGTATVNVSGSSTYDISWSNGATTASITDVPAGAYDVIVTDTANPSCTLNARVTIEEDPACVVTTGNDCDCVNTNIPGYMYLGEFDGHAYYKKTSGDVEYWDALNHANALGGYIVTINSQAENDFVAGFLGGGDIWLGLSDAGSEGNFYWTNGEPVTYTNWAAGEPNNANNEDYVEMWAGGTWNDLSDNNYNWLIVEVPCNCNGGTPPSCGCVNTNIPDYMYLGEFEGSAYYKKTSGDVEYWDALNHANALGGHIVTIGSQAENDFVASVIGSGGIWLGLSDAGSEGNFYWTNGEPVTYTNWANWEPNNYNNEDYVEMFSSGVWNDVSDTDYNWLIVEVPCDCSGSSSSCTNANILFVAQTPLKSGDVTLKSHLMSQGYVVTVIDQYQVNSSSANGYDLVFISSTIASNNIGNAFTYTTVPVIVAEAYLFDDMYMASNWGNYSYTSQIVITDPSHPIAAGCSGTEEVYTSNKQVGWAVPSSSAYKIGRRNNSSSKYMLFAYEAGASMVGLNAPARRVGFFTRDNTANYFTTKGWMLFDGAIEWALGCDGGSTPPPAPTGCTNPTNIALNGTAYQSSTYNNSPAYIAIDGNTSSITRTYHQCNAYWELDLGCVADIDYINVWNRSDYYSYMLDDYYVLVSEFPFSGSLNTILNDPNVWSSYHSTEAGRPSTINVGETGRYICIMLAGCNHLSIAEVEVFGCCTGTGGGSKTASALGNILAGEVEMDKVVEGGALAINKVYPTPAIDFANIEFTVQDAATTQVNVYNIAGQKVIAQTTETQAGQNNLKVDVTGLPSGTYLLEVLNGEHRSVEKIVVDN